ncbi:MAG: membrane protein insertase YidC [Gammaproteobacteria bacterium]|nr:membrane protein insertase YidC [Gammaproteobacteria bacterium]
MRWLRAIAMFFLIAFSSTGFAQQSSGISINSAGGLPQLLADDVRLQWVVPGDPGLTERLNSLQYVTSDDQYGEETRLTVTSLESMDGRQLTHYYFLTRLSDASDSATVRIDLDMPAAAGIELSGQAGFIPEPLPGFGAFYGDVHPIVVDASGQSKFDESAGRSVEHSLAPGDWFGIRNRYWAGLLRSEVTTLDLRVDTASANLPSVTAAPVTEIARLQLELYTGVVESSALVAVDTKLSGMMYAALWEWLRVLCFGMSWLFTFLQSLVGNVGLAIILLSVCVKVLMLPLTMIADRWQESVNKTTALLQPPIDAIKRQYKGEEANKRILAVYRDQNVHPLYTVKSLAGFLIQIPIFIAAFDVLGESVLLNQVSFLWIQDLATPDRVLDLRWEVPFFGAYLNLLPFLMTGVTLLTSWIQTDPSLTPELLRTQRIRLYLMAVAFFLLFYTFPAGMVLYWTTNNVLHLLKIQLGRWRKHAP